MPNAYGVCDNLQLATHRVSEINDLITYAERSRLPAAKFMLRMMNCMSRGIIFNSSKFRHLAELTLGSSDSILRELCSKIHPTGSCAMIHSKMLQRLAYNFFSIKPATEANQEKYKSGMLIRTDSVLARFIMMREATKCFIEYANKKGVNALKYKLDQEEFIPAVYY